MKQRSSQKSNRMIAIESRKLLRGSNAVMNLESGIRHSPGVDRESF